MTQEERWIKNIKLFNRSEFLKTQPMQFLHLVTSKVIGGKVLKPRTMNIV